ncbi:MAG: glycosyltransferase family 4 protein [Bacteroidota bacterium]
MPRVAFISDYTDSLNTVRPEGRLYVGLMRDHGWQVTLLTPAGGNYLDELSAAGAEIIDLKMSGKRDVGARKQIADVLSRKEQAVDVLHLYNNRAIVNGIAATRRAGFQGSLLTYRGYTGNIHWWDPTAYMKHLNPRVNGISCVSPAVKEVFDKLPGGVGERARVIGKGHEPGWYAGVSPLDLQAEFDIPGDKTVVVIVANARRMKGMQYLDAAVKSLSAGLKLHFLYVGRGLDTSATQSAFAASHYSDAVTFAGWRSDVLRILKAADISLLPSVKGEGLSKVLLESMFLGRATIMTDIGGNRHLGIHEATCLVVPPRDPAALAAALTQLGKDTVLRERLGPAGQAYVEEHYHADRTAAELDAWYRELLNRRTG